MEYINFDFYFGDDNKLEVEAEVTPGEPERGPSYASGGEPATDPTAEIASVWIRDDLTGQTVEFHTGGVFYMSHVTGKPKNLDDALIEAAIEQAYDQ